MPFQPLAAQKWCCSSQYGDTFLTPPPPQVRIDVDVVEVVSHPGCGALAGHVASFGSEPHGVADLSGLDSANYPSNIVVTI